MFRNLPRRSQSLLHRQLTLLDTMARRVNDPYQLGDLYRLDHLSTRMRRHAESLIRLSGAVSRRSWRKAVPLVDVLRAAIAEVEAGWPVASCGPCTPPCQAAPKFRPGRAGVCG